MNGVASDETLSVVIAVHPQTVRIPLNNTIRLDGNSEREADSMELENHVASCTELSVDVKHGCMFVAARRMCRRCGVDH